MRKAQLLELLQRVSDATGVASLTIVGSQSLHGQTAFLPETVLRSLEVDIFISPDSDAHRIIDRDFGPDSTHHLATGVYADALGAGIVSLPPGWEERLVTIENSDRSFSYRALEKHDVAVAKLIAGREKDFEFLTDLATSEVLDIATFMERAAMMKHSPYVGALSSRLRRLAAALRERRAIHLLPPVEALLCEV